MLSYRVKIPRGRRAYLWGGEGINGGAQRRLSIPLLLHVRVDDLGEPINLSYNTFPPATQDTYGQLGPGEAYTVTLDSLMAVYAECLDKDTYVDCYLVCPNVST